MRVLFTDSFDNMTIVQNINSAYITDHIMLYDDNIMINLRDCANVVLAFYDPVESDYIYAVLSREEAMAVLHDIMTNGFVDITGYAGSTFFNPTIDEANLTNYFKM